MNKEKILTIKRLRLDIYNENQVDGLYNMPIIRKEYVKPTDLIGFNYIKSCKDKNVGIHMFLDDSQFERLWNNPDKYVEVLKEYECVLSPDFSLYLDMPIAMKLWNVYRSRIIGQYLQNNEVHVIPTISWAEKETFKFCFDGIEKGCIVAISTLGVKRNSESMQIWKDGVDQIIKTIKPSCILCYGGKVDYDFKNTEVIYYENKIVKRFNQLGDG